MKYELKEMIWNMNNEIDNVRSPFFEFNDFTSASKINYFFLLVCLFVSLKNNSIVQLNLFVYKRTQFVQLAGIWLTIQHSSKYLFGLLKIRPDFVLTGGVVIFEGYVSSCLYNSFSWCRFAGLYDIS